MVSIDSYYRAGYISLHEHQQTHHMALHFKINNMWSLNGFISKLLRCESTLLCHLPGYADALRYCYGSLGVYKERILHAYGHGVVCPRSSIGAVYLKANMFVIAREK